MDQTGIKNYDSFKSFSDGETSDFSFSSRIRVNNFSTDGSSGLLLKKYLAKKIARVACFCTFCFQLFVRIFFFAFEVRFC